jgi:hypothetical protein
MPSGWDQKVLLAPYPFNDAASNFRPSFDAQDKMVRLISTLQAATFTTDGNVLADVVASLPPRPLTVFIHGGQSVATVRSQIAGVPDGYRMTDTLVLDGGGAASQSPNVGGVFFPIGLIKTEAQSVYGRTGGGTLDVYVTEVEW